MNSGRFVRKKEKQAGARGVLFLFSSCDEFEYGSPRGYTILNYRPSGIRIAEKNNEEKSSSFFEELKPEIPQLHTGAGCICGEHPRWVSQCLKEGPRDNP